MIVVEGEGNENTRLDRGENVEMNEGTETPELPGMEEQSESKEINSELITKCEMGAVQEEVDVGISP